MMLDDPHRLAKLDSGNLLGVIAGQPAQLKQQFESRNPKSETRVPGSGFRSLVVAGMGGSAIAAEFIRSWLGDRLSVPVNIVRDYDLPQFVGPETLTVISSYSGNTQEALSAFKIAKQRQTNIVVMASGGELVDQSKIENLPLIQIPSGLQPRMAVLFEVKALATLLESAGLAEGITSELEAVADWLSPQLHSWTAEVETPKNQAKQIAEKLFGNVAVVYGGPTLWMAAAKWKIGINENAKNLAFSYGWSEFNHNEMLGWQHPTDKLFRVIELQSSLDRPEIARRFEITNHLLAETWPKPSIVGAQGETKLQQMLWTIILGDYVSAYLAFLNGIDPTPVDLIEQLKSELAQ